MSESISFTVLGRPAPQGSLKPMIRGGRAVLVSQLKTTMPFRQEVGWCALRALEGQEQPFAGKHEPVGVAMNFYFSKPPSAKKSRLFPVTPPDIDKLQRSSFDAMTGIMYADDAQIVSVFVNKVFDAVERVEITVTKL